MRKTINRTWFFLFFTCMAYAVAQPIVPSNDDQVLEILPVNIIPTSQRESLRKAREAWKADPRNIYTVNSLARLYIAQSRQLADPRYLGYAEALLEPWGKSTGTPIPIRVLRATILQRNHQFDSALNEIKHVLQEEPIEPETLLMQATILQVRADYDGAKKSCQHLYNFSTLMIGMVCTAQIDGLTGHAANAFERITTLLQLKNAGLTDDVHDWMLLTYIDLAQRLGRKNEVEKGFKIVLSEHAQLSPEARVMYLDWLIVNGRFQEVVNLGSKELQDDGTVLRLVIAEEALHLPSGALHRTLLRDRFAAARLRGDHVHQREESRFMLEVMHQPKEALVLAQANWLVQREPADAQVLLAAALAADRPEAAQPVLLWLKQWHLEDVNLIRQAQALS